jgi:hypothetical protein
MMARIDADSTTSLYEFCQETERYPLEEILPVANLAGSQDSGMIPEMRSLLSHENPVIRYWAILGLRTLGEKAGAALPEIRKALEDPSASVRIQAAISLGNLGFTVEAVSILLAEARSSGSDAHANWALDGFRYLQLPGAIEGFTEEDLARGQYSQRTFKHLAGGGTMYRIPAKDNQP